MNNPFTKPHPLTLDFGQKAKRSVGYEKVQRGWHFHDFGTSRCWCNNPPEMMVSAGDPIKQTLERLDGVVFVSAEFNHTFSTEGGMSPQSARYTVVGGDDQEIIDAIGHYKDMGVDTSGNESGVYVDSEGCAHAIRFERVTEKTLELIFNIET